MSIGDFVSKTASDALGRIIAQAPSSFAQMCTSVALVTVEIDSDKASASRRCSTVLMVSTARTASL